MTIKALATSAVIAALTLTSTVAFADNFASVRLGTQLDNKGTQDLTLDSYGLAVGHSYANGLSAEAELVALNHAAGTLANLNASYNITTWGRFTPFVSVGVGYAQLNNTVDTDGVVFNARLGTNVNINDAWSVDAAVAKIAAPNLDVVPNKALDATAFTLALKYNF